LRFTSAKDWAGIHAVVQKKFLDWIRQGRKTQTVRLWKWRKMKPGQRSYISGVGYIQISAVDEVALPELTDDDARLDGFESAPALRREIEQLYPAQLAAGYKAFRIRFTVLPPDVQKEMKLAKKEAKAKQATSGLPNS
jgi:hypothetical protein